MSNSFLITPSTFDATKIQFSKAEENQIPNQKLTFKRIKISYEQDNQLTDLVIRSPPNLLSWGLNPQYDMISGQLNGYQLPINLHNRNGASEEELAFTECIHTVVDTSKKHLVATRNEIKKFDLEYGDLKKMNPLYIKLDEKGNPIKDKSPCLYAKCIYNKKQDTISTVFVNELTREKEERPLDLVGKHCFVTFALKVESIFIGTNISLQLKLVEVFYRPRDNNLRSLIDPNILLTNNKSEDVKVSKNRVDDDLVEEEEEEEEEEVEEVEEEEKEEEVEIESDSKVEIIEPMKKFEPVVMKEQKKRTTKAKK